MSLVIILRYVFDLGGNYMNREPLHVKFEGRAPLAPRKRKETSLTVAHIYNKSQAR